LPFNDLRGENSGTAGRIGEVRLVGAGPPPASTKRATLIGMLERTQGASVGEIGQRLGWLPHTVRAAIAGLRHAGREVTRSKDENGQSVYRLDPVETADR
jgi:DNA-binding MarR family transcriptional regulator